MEGEALPKREFTIYVLSDQNSVNFTECFTAFDLFEAHAKARSRLREGARVELWEGPICVLRMRRGV